MKNLFNKVVAAFLLIPALLGAQFSGTINTSPDSVSTVGAVIYSASFQNATTNAVTLKLYDAPSTSTNYVRAAYTQPTGYTTNIVSSFTNPASGVTETTTNSFFYTYNATVAASTNTYRLIGTFTVSASSTLQWQPTDPAPGYLGVLGVATDDITATVNYTPLTP